jgi:hypothetical protein
MYYDEYRDVAKRKEIRAERSRLIQKMLAAKAGGLPTVKPSPQIKQSLHCEEHGEGE